MTKEFLPGSNESMGEKHQGLKVAGVQNHVSHAAPVRSIASRFHLRVFQIAPYHFVILSDMSIQKHFN
jgi:hypothetical protein